MSIIGKDKDVELDDLVLRKPAPVEAERISDADIDRCVRKYDKLLGGCPLCDIIRQQQKDLSELKAECLPWIKGELYRMNYESPKFPSTIEKLERLIQKLGGTK